METVCQASVNLVVDQRIWNAETKGQFPVILYLILNWRVAGYDGIEMESCQNICPRDDTKTLPQAEGDKSSLGFPVTDGPFLLLSPEKPYLLHFRLNVKAN